MAMTFTLIMGIMLFAGGVRIGHVVFLGIVAIPLLWRQVEHVQYALLRMTSFLNPGNAPVEAGYSHSVALCMNVAAIQTGQKVTFDEKTQQVMVGGKAYE